MWGFDFLWPLIWLFVIAAIVVGVVYLFSTRTYGSGSDQAMEALRKQYARGEITDEEFEKRSSRLSPR